MNFNIKLASIFPLLSLANCAKILGIFYIPCVSHQQVYQTLMKELSLKGHEVVSVTPNPISDPELTNLAEISLEYVYNKKRIVGDAISRNYVNFQKNIFKFAYGSAELALQNRRVAELCNGNETFDLVIVEAFTPVMYNFGVKCKAATIGIVSMDAILSSHINFGNPIHPTLYGDFIIPYQTNKPLLDRILNTYYFLWFKHYYLTTILGKSEQLKNKYIGKHLPPTEESEKSSSFLFINTNVVVHNLRPLMPNTIALGGFMHIRKNRALSRDLQTVLDNATQGAVYFSLGSNVRSSELPAPTVKLIKEALSEVPYTVLWKWESDNVPDVGNNVITRKWFPQQDILAHKNLKGFVTQGGLQSTEEAIHYGVPMVGIPFLGDQEMNVKQSVKQGIALYLDHNTMTKDDLKNSIIEIMKNPKYYQRIQELKEIAQDQPMTGLERAVWWSEYVIRHKGAKHLRSPVADMPVWEYLMLDVIAVVLTALIIAVFVLYKISKFLFRFLFGKSKKLKKA